MLHKLEINPARSKVYVGENPSVLLALYVVEVDGLPTEQAFEKGRGLSAKRLVSLGRVDASKP